MLLFICGFIVKLPLAAVFCARALGAGFRPGVRPTVSTALTIGWTGRRFSRPYLRMRGILVPTASAFGLSYKQ